LEDVDTDIFEPALAALIYARLEPVRDQLSKEVSFILDMLTAKFPSFVSWADYSKEEKDKNRKLLHKDLFKKVMALKSKFPELVKVM